MSSFPPHRLGPPQRTRSRSPRRTATKKRTSSPPPSSGYSYSRVNPVRPQNWRKQQYLMAYDHKIHQGHSIVASPADGDSHASPDRKRESHREKSKRPKKAPPPPPEPEAAPAPEEAAAPAAAATDSPTVRGAGIAMLRFTAAESRDRGLSMLRRAQLPAQEVGSDQLRTSFKGKEMLVETGVVRPRVFLDLLARSAPGSAGWVHVLASFVH